MMLRKLLIPLLLISQIATAQDHQSFYFDFGKSNVQKGYIGVGPETIYQETTGYGFDFNTLPQFYNEGKGSALKRDGVSSNQPFYFSVKLPEGNYQVTLGLGSKKIENSTTVKAESRRLMLENISTNKGEFKEETFIVNIKDKNIKSGPKQGERVGLKERELSKLDWDDKLTLEFDNQTVLYSLEIMPTDDQVTVFLSGNSTVVNQDTEPWASWGQMIPRFFKPGVAIANHAESGLTLGSFKNSRRLDKILSIAKPGDYLFIEFGHNDQKEKGPNDGAYKSYTERLKYFVTSFREKGGNAVILTSTRRRAFDESGNLMATLGDFPDAARKVAQELDVPLIDLNAKTKLFYEALGVEDSKKALVHYPANTYPGQDKALADNTHFNPYGAYETAKMVVQGIQDNRLSIAKFIKDFKNFDSSKPDRVADWKWPESPRIEIDKPDGN